MSEHEIHHHHGASAQGPVSWIVRILMITLLVVIGYYLITEHAAHVLAGLPLLFLLACPLMHVFMHGGHGHHSGRAPAPSSQSSDRSPP